jgi:poly(A) polymerase
MSATSRIDPPAWMTGPEARRVLDALGAGGAPARFVGGCVRDAILGRDVTDIDIATPEPPDQVIALLDAAGIRSIPTGLAHGTVTALVEPRHFEITTLRHDVKTFGRHAEVAFHDDWEADAARRDLTINAMSCTADGDIFDYVGGRDDLAAGRIRFVGDAATRIEEDHLRLLRFFRFYAHYGTPPPDATALAACRAWAGSLAKLSGERIAKETLTLLAAPAPGPVLALMAETGVLAELLPEATGATGLLDALVALEAEPDSVRRLAALLVEAETDEAATRAVAGRWRLSNVQGERLAAFAAPAQPVGREDSPAIQRARLYREGAERVRDATLLGWAAARVRGEDADAAFGALVALVETWTPVELPVGGSDVLALGVPAGPEVGAILAEIEAWWIEHDFQPDHGALLGELATRIAVRLG